MPHTDSAAAPSLCSSAFPFLRCFTPSTSGFAASGCSSGFVSLLEILNCQQHVTAACHSSTSQQHVTAACHSSMSQQHVTAACHSSMSQLCARRAAQLPINSQQRFRRSIEDDLGGGSRCIVSLSHTQRQSSLHTLQSPHMFRARCLPAVIGGHDGCMCFQRSHRARRLLKDLSSPISSQVHTV